MLGEEYKRKERLSYKSKGLLFIKFRQKKKSYIYKRKIKCAITAQNKKKDRIKKYLSALLKTSKRGKRKLREKQSKDKIKKMGSENN